MSSSQEQFMVAAGEAARNAPKAAGRIAQEAGAFPIRLGVIAGAQGGAYTVDLLAADGTTASTLEGVRPFGGGGHVVGEQVFLVWLAGRSIPLILGASGEGGSGDGVVGYLRFFGE